MRSLLVAIQFLTRLPLPKSILHESDYQPVLLGRSVLFYPLVGLLIGSILYLSIYCLKYLSPELSSLVIAAIVLCLWVLITGALHLDGLSDSADAWVGGYGDRDKTLAIMKDPYTGPAGVSMIVLVLLLKFSLLSVVVNHEWTAVVLSPVLARAMIILLFLTIPYVRQDGIGSQPAASIPAKPAWLVLLCIFALCGYLYQIQAIWLIASLLIVFFLLCYIMMQRIGGTTGDTAGATIEFSEVIVLLVFIL